MNTMPISVDDAQRVVSPTGEDDPALRPRMLADFQGQPRACELLAMGIAGARSRCEPLDHVLLFGPPGLGKTTLAHILAAETGGGFRSAAAPSIQRPADLAAMLVTLERGDVLFIDEIHRLPKVVAEILYGAMEDFRIDIMTGAPGAAQAISIPLPRFTLVGATTRSGQLDRPFRDRFGIDARLELYSDADLAKVAGRSASLLGLSIREGVAEAIARRSRGTPRIANRLVRRLRDYATYRGADGIDLPLAEEGFEFLEIDPAGLDARDRRYLSCLRERGRPTGLSTLAASLGEDGVTLEDEVEPWLLKCGLMDRTPKGRILGPAAAGQGKLV